MFRKGHLHHCTSLYFQLYPCIRSPTHTDHCAHWARWRSFWAHPASHGKGGGRSGVSRREFLRAEPVHEASGVRNVAVGQVCRARGRDQNGRRSACYRPSETNRSPPAFSAGCVGPGDEEWDRGRRCRTKLQPRLQHQVTG